MIQQIKSYIAKGKTKDAIDVLRSFEVTHPKLEKEILSITSRYNILTSNVVKGILENNEINIETQKIHNSILIICELVERSEKNEASKKILNRKKLKYSFFVLPCLVIGVIILYSSVKDNQGNILPSNSSEILEMSEGYNGYPSAVLSSVLELARSKEIFIVAATGNDSPCLDDIFTDTNGVSIEYPAYFNNSSNTINYTFNPRLKAKEYFDIGISFKDVGNYEMAQLNFTKAIQDSISFTEAYLERGIIKRKIGNYEGAIKDYNIALKLSPNNPVVFLSRSVVYLKINEFDKAMKNCDLAIKINPNLPKAYNSKGNILFSQGCYEEAIIEYSKAIELDTFYNYSLIGRGMAKYEIGEDSSVYCADIMKVINLNPNSDLSLFKEMCK